MRLVLAALLGLALAGPAHANGRPPATSTINFRAGSSTDIAAGMTFGLMMSSDGGETWHWVCEDAIGYGGTFDPDYVYTASGALLATTFEGLRANRDGCVFEPAAAPANFFSTIAQGPDGVLHLGAGQVMAGSVPGDSRLYRSTDDGLTFLPPAVVGLSGDWWSSIEVAPSSGARIYASGYRFVQGAKTVFLYRSTDGGATYEPLPTTGLMLPANAKIEIAGIGAANPDLVVIKVVQENNLSGDGVYRSTDGGQTWTRVYGAVHPLSILLRANGQLIAASVDNGAEVSSDGGATWAPLVGPPHINCLAETAAGEVWACTRGFSPPGVPNDGFAIMKSTDLAAWTGVMAYRDLQAPIDCPTDTLHDSRCEHPPEAQAGICGLCSQLGCTPSGCTVVPDGAPVDAPIADDGGGCCDTGGGAASAFALGGGGLATLLLGGLRRRRTRPAG